MKKEKIEKTVIDLINKQFPYKKALLTIEEAKARKEIYFNQDIGFDSLKIVELFMECEEKFNITFDDAEIIKTDTVEKLIDKLEEKINSK